MGKSKLQIPMVCKYCGNTFLAKTVKTGYCSHHCASSASNDRKKLERRQKVLDRIKAAGTEYITITEALKIFTTSRNTIRRLVISKKIGHFRISPKRWFVCVKDLEALFPLKIKPIVVETPKASQVFDMNPKNCYTIGEITKRFGTTESSVYKHIRQFSIPIRQIGNYVYVPKKEIDKMYKIKMQGNETEPYKMHRKTTETR